MSNLLATVGLPRLDAGGWAVDRVFSSNEPFFRARGIDTPAVLADVVAMIPGIDEMGPELLLTYGFSVNFLSRRVSGYVAQVSKSVDASHFYSAEQYKTAITVFSCKMSTSTRAGVSTEACLKAAVAHLEEKGFWSRRSDDEELGPDEMRTSIDRRVFASSEMQGDSRVVFLYIKAGPTTQPNFARGTVEDAVKGAVNCNRWVEKTLTEAAAVFYREMGRGEGEDEGGDDDNDDDASGLFTPPLHFRTVNDFVVHHGRYWFLNNCSLAAPDMDVVPFFANDSGRLIVMRAIDADSAGPDTISDLFADSAKVSRLTHAGLAFVPAESPIANARLMCAASDKCAITGGVSIKEHCVEPVGDAPDCLDMRFEATITYVKVVQAVYPRSMERRVLVPATVPITVKPVYYSTKREPALCLGDLARVRDRCGYEFVPVDVKDWHRILEAQMALRDAGYFFDDTRMGKGVALFPTAAILGIPRTGGKMNGQTRTGGNY